MTLNPPPPSSAPPSDGLRRAPSAARQSLDAPLLAITLSLVLIGLVSVYSASAPNAQADSGASYAILLKQALAAGVGLWGMMLVSRLPFTLWRRLAKPIALTAIGLLLITLLFGQTVNGSERWIALPFGFQFQPSDVAKLAAILLMAQATCRRRLLTFTLFPNLALVAVMVALIYQQPNLSVSIIIGVMTLAMLFIGGFSVPLLLLGLPLAGYGVFLKVMTVEYQRRRIQGWLDPWADMQDTGYNLIQSYYAIGSGGIFGVGFGHSAQKMHYLPFPYTDFIFSVICEEWGLFGSLIIVGLFALFGWRGFTIARQCESPFGQMLAFGLTCAILLQALINISVTIGMMPVTGVTLPFISYGGTSMILTLVMTGILLSVSRHRPRPRVASWPQTAS